MKIAEVTNKLMTFIATVRVNNVVIKTSIQADSAANARMLLLRLYGTNNVTGIGAATATLEDAGASAQVTDAGEKQVKALADQARRISQQKRQLQARQGLAKAQERLRQASKV